jgi:hypothetical protein
VGEPTIPVALDPYDNKIPIEEAIRGKGSGYYCCHECREPVIPKKGPKNVHHYAHKAGTVEDGSCSLSTQQDVDDLVDKLRTSNIEEEERRHRIRVHLGEVPGDRIKLFGVIPSLEWDDIPTTTGLQQVFESMDIQTEGIYQPPVAENFAPTESEVSLDLDPSADNYLVEITGDAVPDKLRGTWSAEPLADGDVFLGDQTRSRRFVQDRQVKPGEWVYLIVDARPTDLPDIVTVHELEDKQVLGFPARDETEALLETHGPGFTTDNHGFDADVIFPSRGHPTSEAPIEAPTGEMVLVGVTPAEEIDPVFEIVPIPRSSGDVDTLDQTGPGNPRFYRITIPSSGSRRISIHQRNSSRHRMIHLHSGEEIDPSKTEPGRIGLEISSKETDAFIGPLTGETTHNFPTDYAGVSLPIDVEYCGPEGLELELTAIFKEGASMGPQLTRTTTDLAATLEEVSFWIEEGCTELIISFDGLGRVRLLFPAEEET